MLLDLGGKPLVRWATDAAIEAFGRENVVAAIPASEENDELARVLAEVCEVFRWDGPENDVLGRLVVCAMTYRWDQEAVVARITPDDPWKDPHLMRRVVAGGRLPVETSCEAMRLHEWVRVRRNNPGMVAREHLTCSWLYPPPKASPAPYPLTIDTQADLDEARAWLARQQWGETASQALAAAGSIL